MTAVKKIIALSLLAIPIAFAAYYYYPVQKIPAGITIDSLVVLKSQHKLIAYAQGTEVVQYTVAIAQNPIGDKRTPEGHYTIFDKNPNSDYHKNLGVSYPNAADIAQAKAAGKHTGGDIKIHGLKNGKG